MILEGRTHAVKGPAVVCLPVHSSSAAVTLGWSGSDQPTFGVGGRRWIGRHVRSTTIKPRVPTRGATLSSMCPGSSHMPAMPELTRASWSRARVVANEPDQPPCSASHMVARISAFTCRGIIDAVRAETVMAVLRARRESPSPGLRPWC